MPIGTTVSIPDFQFYGGVPPASVTDAAGYTFYCGFGWYGGPKTAPGTYLFRISALGKVTNIPLSPQPTSQGALEVDALGLTLTCTTADKNVVRYRIAEYTPGPPGSPVAVVVTGDAADAQARNAIAKLQHQTTDIIAKDHAQDDAIHLMLTTAALKEFLWNDHFIVDLLYDIIHNRKDKGIRDSIAEMIRDEMKK